MIISDVQQSDSVTHVHTPVVFRFFSHIGYYRLFGRVPCVIQQVPVANHSIYLKCAYANPNPLDSCFLITSGQKRDSAWWACGFVLVRGVDPPAENNKIHLRRILHKVRWWFASPHMLTHSLQLSSTFFFFKTKQNKLPPPKKKTISFMEKKGDNSSESLLPPQPHVCPHRSSLALMLIHESLQTPLFRPLWSRLQHFFTLGKKCDQFHPRRFFFWMESWCHCQPLEFSSLMSG